VPNITTTTDIDLTLTWSSKESYIIMLLPDFSCYFWSRLIMLICYDWWEIYNFYRIKLGEYRFLEFFCVYLESSCKLKKKEKLILVFLTMIIIIAARYGSAFISTKKK
jgi:hypothetical protein